MHEEEYHTCSNAPGIVNIDKNNSLIIWTTLYGGGKDNIQYGNRYTWISIDYAEIERMEIYRN